MEIEPAPLAGFALGEGPADRWVEVEVSGGGEVICSVHEPFKRFIHSSFGCSWGLVVPGGRGEFCAKEIFSIHEMDARACAERSF